MIFSSLELFPIANWTTLAAMSWLPCLDACRVEDMVSLAGKFWNFVIHARLNHIIGKVRLANKALNIRIILSLESIKMEVTRDEVKSCDVFVLSSKNLLTNVSISWINIASLHLESLLWGIISEDTTFMSILSSLSCKPLGIEAIRVGNQWNNDHDWDKENRRESQPKHIHHDFCNW